MPAVTGIARLEVAGVRVAHCHLPAWEADEAASVSEPSSIALSFTAQRGATLGLSGRAADREVPANSLGAAGGEAIAWVRTDAPCELVEVTASRELRLSVAEEVGVPHHADLAPLFDAEAAHPVAWAIAARLRAGARGGRTLDAIEVETLARRLYAHVLCARFGGLMPQRRGALDPRRLDRVLDYVEAHLREALSVDRLASVAALTPFHFLRSFKRAMGVTPHDYVRMRRLEATQAAIQSGTSPEEALHEIGYVNIGHARRAFAAHFGFAPDAAAPRRESR